MSFEAGKACTGLVFAFEFPLAGAAIDAPGIVGAMSLLFLSCRAGGPPSLTGAS